MAQRVALSLQPEASAAEEEAGLYTSKYPDPSGNPGVRNGFPEEGKLDLKSQYRKWVW